MQTGSIPVASLPPPRQLARVAEPDVAAAVGGRVSSSDWDRLSYARDMWPLALLWIRQGRIPPPPDLVAWPKDEAEVQALVGAARKHRLALVPYGAGSGVCGGTWAVHGGVSMDLKRLDSISDVDPVRRTVDVGAGVLGEVLERRLASQGWTLGHFPSSIYMSTVGGWLATRGAGQLSSRYGKIEDMVVSLRAVLGTGELRTTPERPFRGPDEAQLLIGSEGAFGAITHARLRVHPAPAGRSLHGFECQSVSDGLEIIRLVFRAGLRPAVVRLYDPFDTAAVGEAPHGKAGTAPDALPFWKRTLRPAAYRAFAPHTVGRPGLINALAGRFKKSLLVLAFEGEARRSVEEGALARDIALRLRAKDLGEEPARSWFAKRYDVSYKMSRLIEAGTFVDTMEVSAPWDRVVEVYERVRAAVKDLAFVLCHFSHAYLDGCSLYFSFVGSGRTEEEVEQRYRALWRAAQSGATTAGANVSHHHGVGLLKAQNLQDALGEGRWALSALKHHYDPDGVMNPGKLGL